MCVQAKSLQSCPTLWNPLDYSLAGSSVHGILKASILEWVAMPFSPGDLPNPGVKPGLFHLLPWYAGSLPLAPPQFSSVQSSVMSNSLQPHELQHARPPCPSPTPRVHSDSCPSSASCHPAISSSVVPFSSCPQSLPDSESFQ